MARKTGLGQVATWVVALLAVLGALTGDSLAQTTVCRYDTDCQEPLVCSASAPHGPLTVPGWSGTQSVTTICRPQCRPGVERDCLHGYACTLPRVESGTGAALNLADYARCLLPGTRYILRQPTPQGVWVSEVEPATDVWRRLMAPGFAQPSQPPGVAQAPRPVALSPSPYFQGRDGALWVRTPDGREQSTTAGAISTAEVASAGLPGGSALVFLRHNDRSIRMIDCRAATCGSWVSLGGVLASPPTASLAADGSVVVRATGMDNRTWQNVVRDGRPGGWAPAP